MIAPGLKPHGSVIADGQRAGGRIDWAETVDSEGGLQTVDRNDPRTLLERSEEAQGSDTVGVGEVSAGLGRILAWIADAATTEQLALRTLIFLSKLRPDLCDESMQAIGQRFNLPRSRVGNLCKEFEAIFCFRGLNTKTDTTRRRLAAAWRLTHPATGDTKLKRPQSPLIVVNRFARWLSERKAGGPMTEAETQQALRDLAPIIAWAAKAGALARPNCGHRPKR